MPALPVLFYPVRLAVGFTVLTVALLWRRIESWATMIVTVGLVIVGTYSHINAHLAFHLPPGALSLGSFATPVRPGPPVHPGPAVCPNQSTRPLLSVPEKTTRSPPTSPSKSLSSDAVLPPIQITPVAAAGTSAERRMAGTGGPGHPDW